MACSYGQINNTKDDMRGSKMNRKWLTLIFLMAVVCLQLAACANVKPDHLVQDSGYRALGISGWLDNHTVVFYSEQRAQAKPGDGSEGPSMIDAGYYLWDTETEKIAKYVKLEGAAKLCAQGSYVSFLRKSPTNETQWVVVTRANNQETVTPLVNPQWFNRFSCRYYDQKPDWDRGHASLPLFDGHGALYLKDSRQNNRIMFFPPNSETSIALPIGTRQVWHNLVRYAPFKTAYLLYPVAYIDPETGIEEPVGPWPKGKPVQVWWLTPDGTVTTEEIPYMHFMRGGSRGFYPTRAGIFITSHMADEVGKPGDAGGYLAQGNRVQKLITGLLEDVSVSPDGCHVAFSHNPYTIEPLYKRIHVKVLSLCQEVSHVR